jgi:peptide/nickel transport system substrate-binding protein
MQAQGYNVIAQRIGAAVLIPDSANADSPWSNLKVRLAAEYAIDKSAICKTFGYGYWQPAYQIPSPTVAGYNEKLESRTFDVAKARQLMSEAGYPDGFKSTIVGPPGVDQNVLVALQSYLGAIGIKCDLQFPQASGYQQYMTGTWHNALVYNPLLEWVNYNDALNFYFGEPPSVFKSLKHPDGWPEMLTTSAVSPIVDATRPTGDPALIQKLVETAYNDCMVIPINYGAATTVLQNNVRDIGLGERQNSWEINADFTWLSK